MIWTVSNNPLLEKDVVVDTDVSCHNRWTVWVKILPQMLYVVCRLVPWISFYTLSPFSSIVPWGYWDQVETSLAPVKYNWGGISSIVTIFTISCKNEAFNLLNFSTGNFDLVVPHLFVKFMHLRSDFAHAVVSVASPTNLANLVRSWDCNIPLAPEMTTAVFIALPVSLSFKMYCWTMLSIFILNTQPFFLPFFTQNSFTLTSSSWTWHDIYFSHLNEFLQCGCSV